MQPLETNRPWFCFVRLERRTTSEAEEAIEILLVNHLSEIIASKRNDYSSLERSREQMDSLGQNRLLEMQRY